MPRDPNESALPAGTTSLVVLVLLVLAYFAWSAWDLRRERPRVFQVAPEKVGGPAQPGAGK